MSNVICVYHGIDLDGQTSAAIVLEKFPNAKLIPYNYGQAVPDIEPNADVVICDVAFPMEVMDEIATKSNSFTWIDHHISSIKKYEEYLKNHPVRWTTILARNGELIGACELTWKHFFHSQIPPAVFLLGGYDSFRHKGKNYEQLALYFQLAAQSVANSPETAAQLLDLTEKQVKEMGDNGKIIFDYKKSAAQETYKMGVPVKFGDKKFIVFNSDRFNPSNYGLDYHKDGYDGTGSFYFDGKIWHFSLYNDDGSVDCSEIAKQYGGGGHRGASGWEPSLETITKILQSNI